MVLFGVTLSATVKECPSPCTTLDDSAASRALLRELFRHALFQADAHGPAERALASGEALATLRIAPGFARRARAPRGPRPTPPRRHDLARCGARSYLDALEQVMPPAAPPAARRRRAFSSPRSPGSIPMLLDAIFFLPGVIASSSARRRDPLRASLIARRRGDLGCLALDPLSNAECSPASSCPISPRGSCSRR